MNKKFLSLQIVILFSLFFTITYIDSALSQNYWERTSGPGTVTVNDFVIKDDFILIGTYNGGIYKSIDNGENWHQIENELTGKSVYALELLSNGDILAGTTNGIQLSSDNGETWFHSALPNYLVSIIVLDDEDFIYVASYYGNDIYRSGDGGINWEPLNSGLSLLTSMLIKNLETILVSQGGWIYRSSDRGQSWNPVLSGNKWIIDIALDINGNFNAISQFGSFYRSSNDGITWDSVSVLPTTPQKIYNAINGDIYIGSFGVYRSTNGGENWVLLNGFQGCNLVRTISEKDNLFYAGSFFSGIFRSTDFGTNWIQSSQGLNSSQVLFFEKYTNGKIFAGSLNSSLSTTTDNGENWPIISGLTQLNSLSSSPNGNLFASNPGGAILKSVDSGFNWEVIYLAADFSQLEMVKVSQNESIFAIINGKLIRSINNGEVWDTIQLASEYELITKLNVNTQGILFAKSSEGYFRSSDNGETWTQLTSIPNGLNIFGITKFDEMFATASDSGFYRSTDYGDSWNYIYKSNGYIVRAFADNSLGYLFIVLQNSRVLRSFDNGLNWQEINSGLDGSSINCLIITDDDFLLAGTNWKGVYRSVNKTTSVENSLVTLPDNFLLEQNYPNPFNPSTNIKFKIADYGFVSLKVFDILGKEIMTLLNEEKPAGQYEFNFDATGLSSGIYFYQLKTGSFIETRKMIHLK